MSNMESKNSQNGGLEGYNNISDEIFHKEKLKVHRRNLQILPNFNVFFKNNLHCPRFQLCIFFSLVCFDFPWNHFWIYFGCLLKVK